MTDAILFSQRVRISRGLNGLGNFFLATRA